MVGSEEQFKNEIVLRSTKNKTPDTLRYIEGYREKCFEKIVMPIKTKCQAILFYQYLGEDSSVTIHNLELIAPRWQGTNRNYRVCGTNLILIYYSATKI